MESCKGQKSKRMTSEEDSDCETGQSFLTVPPPQSSRKLHNFHTLTDLFVAKNYCELVYECAAGGCA